MKKYLSIILVSFLIFCCIGCGKKETNSTKNLTQEEVIKDLKSDEKKLVYDNGGAYKLVFHISKNTIVKLEHYYEYEDEAEAEKVYKEDVVALQFNDTINEVTRVKNYVIYDLAESEFKDLSISDIETKYPTLTKIK